MELQELVVRTVISQMRFRLAPRFLDSRGALVEKLRREFELSDYGWGQTQLQVLNADRTRVLIVAATELRLVYEHLERIDDYVEAGRRFFAEGLGELGIDQVEFLGIRTYWLAAVDSFADLAVWLRKRLSPSDPVTAAVNSKPTDLGWVVEFQEKDPKHRITIAPMKVDQLVEQFVGTDKRELFPPEFLFVDIDRFFNATTVDTAAAIDRWEDALQKNLDLGERIAALLTGDNSAEER
jgi:hypothetical protein